MKISCPFCHQHYEVDTPTPDKSYRCLYCGEQFHGGMAEPVEAGATAPAPAPTMPAAPSPAPRSAPVIHEISASRKLPTAALALGIVTFAGLALLAFAVFALLGETRNLKREIAELRSAGQTRQQPAATAAVEPPPKSEPAPPVAVQDFNDLKEQLDTLLQTQNGIRAWQSKYTATLDQLSAMVENQSLEQAFAQVHGAINELYSPKGAFAKVYSAISQLSKAANDNLVILNQNVTALTQYTGQLADSIDTLNTDFNQINRDLGNLFGRVNRLERNNSGFIYVAPRPAPGPFPRPPQLRTGSSINIKIGD